MRLSGCFRTAGLKIFLEVVSGKGLGPIYAYQIVDILKLGFNPLRIFYFYATRKPSIIENTGFNFLKVSAPGLKISNIFNLVSYFQSQH